MPVITSYSIHYTKLYEGNAVFIAIGNDETAAVKAWKLLVASGVQNVYILEGGINRWIATFGAQDAALIPLATAGEDQRNNFV